jgi:SNF2 family DNA or RNA helicase
VRWGAVTSADSRALQAPFRSGIAIEDFQLDPVVRALGMPRANLLMADDVGLGKTVEAGLVVQELLLRHRARSVIVVCPASLQIKWQDEMREKFGLEFRIVDRDLLRLLRRTRGTHVNPFAHFPRLMVSIDWLKADRPMSLLREVLPPVPTYPRRFDVLVVDEVHNVAPAGGGSRYKTDTLRTMSVRTLAPHCQHRLFLSATPHNGYANSFSALLELLDPQRFARGVEPEKDQLSRAMVRRLKSEITNPDGSPRFPERKVIPLEVSYSQSEREIYAKLKRYGELRLGRIKQEAGGRERAAEFLQLLLKKRLFSSPAAFIRTLPQHRGALARAGEVRDEPPPDVRLVAAFRRPVEPLVIPQRASSPRA